MWEMSQQEEEEQPPLPTAPSPYSGKSQAGTDLVGPIRHGKGEGIPVLFRVTGVDVPDAARGQVCLAEGTNSCPWKMNSRREMSNRKSEAGKNYRKWDIFSHKNSYLGVRTQILIQVRLPHKPQLSQGFSWHRASKKIQASFDLILLGVGLLGQRRREAGRKMLRVTLGLSLLGRTNPTMASLRMSKRPPGLTAIFQNAFQVSVLSAPPCTPAFSTKPLFQHRFIVTSLQAIRRDTATERYLTSILKSS